MNTDFLVILCTCPTAADADVVATALVEQQLAACVNRIGGVRSLYRWKGKVEQDDEILLVIKTEARCFDAVEQTIAALHPADVPEIIGMPVAAGSAAYLDWLRSSLA